MIIYISIYILVTIVYLNSEIHTEQSSTYSSVILGGLIIGLGVFVAISDMLGGYDRYLYGEMFEHIGFVMRTGGDPYRQSILFKTYHSEPGFAHFTMLSAFFFQNRYVFIFIYTIVLYLLLLTSLLKYTNRSPLSVILFMGLWFFFTFTYLRQAMAAAIVWLSIEYAIKRKPWPFFIIVALAYSFHNSAIIFALVYFLPMKKIDIPPLIALFFILLFVGTTGIPDKIFGQFGEVTSTNDRITAMLEAHDSSFRVAYLIEAIVFLSLILSKYKDFDPDNKAQIMMLNLALTFCGTLLFFINSFNGGRLSWYFMIGLFSTLTYLGTGTRTSISYSTFLIILCLTLFIRILIVWNILIYPYKTFFTNGHRDGDFIYEIYEYDKLYDADKFYKW